MPKPRSKARSRATSSPISTSPPATRSLSRRFSRWSAPRHDSDPNRLRARQDPGRGAELHPRTGQRTGQPDDADRLAQRATAMAARIRPGVSKCWTRTRMRQLGMGSLLGVAQGSAEPPALIIIRYKPAAAPKTNDHLGAGRQRRHLRHRRRLHQARRRHGEDEVRHGRRRGDARRHAGNRAIEAADSGHRVGARGREHGRQQAPSAPAISSNRCPARPSKC